MPKALKKRKYVRRNLSLVDGGQDQVAGSSGESGELDDEGEAPVAPTLGGAIETVRQALEPFDPATRKKVVRAAEVMLK